MRRALRKYTGFNVAAPGINTGITGGVQPTNPSSTFQVAAALATSSVVNVTCTDGTTTHKWGLNASAALSAADLYHFTFDAPKTDQNGTALTYDVEIETDGLVEFLTVTEIVAEGGR